MLIEVNNIFDPSVPAVPKDVFAGNAPQDFSSRVPPVAVMIETAPGSNEFAPADRIDWVHLSRGMDGDDTKLQLVTHLDANDLGAGGELGSRHFSHLMETLGPDRRVRIAQGRGASPAVVLFQGFPQLGELNWSDRSQAFKVPCISEGQERLATGVHQQILGRIMRFDPLFPWNPADADAVTIAAMPPIFNAGGKPNRSTTAYPIGTPHGTFHVHLWLEDNAPEAEMWRFVDALRHLVYFYVLSDPLGAPVSVVEFLRDTEGLVELGASPEDPDPFVRRITAIMDDASVQSQSVREALVLLCDEARLHHEVAIRNGSTGHVAEPEHFLRIFATLETEEEVQATPDRQMIAPEVRDMPREAPFIDLDGRTAADIATANATVQAALSIDRRVISAPLYVGGVRLEEVTLLLRPLWTPHDMLDNLVSPAEQEAAMRFWEGQFGKAVEFDNGLPTSIYHALHRDFHTVRKVGRLWGFPDDHRLLDPTDGEASPLARDRYPAEFYSPFDPDDGQRLVYGHPWMGAGIEASAQWAPRRRPFGDTIGRIAAATERAPVVWMNFNAPDLQAAMESSEGWIALRGNPTIDPERAAIWLPFPNLLLDTSLRADINDEWDDDKYLLAYIEQRLAVAITCTIEGDARLSAAPHPAAPSGLRRRHQVHDHGRETFVVRNRSHNAFRDLFPTDDEPEYDARDDTERLETWAAEDAEFKKAETVAGTIEIPWLDDEHYLGDSFSGVDGLGVAFDSYPEVKGIQYVNVPGGGHRTMLHLTDLREAPEVEGISE